MADQIRVLIVDDIPETRDHLTKLLGFESDIDVVGSAASGAEAIALATSLTPDVVLMDINMPDMDGIAATELLGRAVPTASVVMMSVQGEADYLRRSMLAGAREFLVKPFSSDELTASIRQVHTREREKASRLAVAAPAEAAGGGPVGTNPSGEPGQVVALFSPKGGVGRTTVAVNMAVAAATELGKKVVLVDGSFQFGDVGVLLNLNPKNKSIADLVPELEQAGNEVESIDTFVINHSAGHPRAARTAVAGDGRAHHAVGHQARHRGAAAHPRPRRRGLHRVLQRHDAGDPRLRRYHPDDAEPRDHEHQEHAPLPGGRRAARIREGKVRLVLNRADSALGIRVADVEHSIGRKVDETIVSDGRSVVYALNRGVPFFLSNREAQVSQDILRLARSVFGDRSQVAATEETAQGHQQEIVVRMALIVSTGTVEAFRPSGREGV